MKKLLLVMFSVMFVVSVFAASDTGTDMYVNSSEPKFLRGIGPREPRTDNPVAAGITVVGVGIVLYIGLRAERKKEAIQKKMDSI